MIWKEGPPKQQGYFWVRWAASGESDMVTVWSVGLERIDCGQGVQRLTDITHHCPIPLPEEP